MLNVQNSSCRMLCRNSASPAPGIDSAAAGAVAVRGSPGESSGGSGPISTAEPPSVEIERIKTAAVMRPAPVTATQIARRMAGTPGTIGTTTRKGARPAIDPLRGT